MKKITLIFTCLLLLILAIGCASAAAVSSDSPDLSSNYAVEHVSCDDSINLQGDTELVSDASDSVECESSSDSGYSSSIGANKLRPIGPQFPSTYGNGESNSNDQNNVTASFLI